MGITMLLYGTNLNKLDMGGPITTLIPLVHWNCIPKDKNDIQLLRIIQWDQIPEVQFQLGIQMYPVSFHTTI